MWCIAATIGLVNSSNNLQTQYTYEPFGNVTTTGQASSYPFLFGGMELDSSGLYHTQTRYYSPTLGRFLSADAGLPANAFTYANNDPINAIDPTGKSPEHVSGFYGSSPASDDPIRATDSHSESGGSLAGTMLAQTCDQESCIPINPHVPDSSQGGILGAIIGFFVSLFGGGGSDPVVLNSTHRLAHYPAMSFITDSRAQLQEFTPDNKESSVALEVAVGVLVIGVLVVTGLGLFAALAAAEGAGEVFVAAEEASELGDLTVGEINQIQNVVDQAGRPLDVVGSAARAARTAASDIDYTTANANYENFGDLESQLPGIDPEHGILRGYADPNIGPSIRFEPGVPPSSIPGKP